MPTTDIPDLNLYRITYHGLPGEYPEHSNIVTATTAGAARYKEYLGFQDAGPAEFTYFLSLIKSCKKIASNKQSDPDEMHQYQDRIDVVNKLIQVIGSKGRRFLYSGKHDRYTKFYYANSVLWMVDGYSNHTIPMLPDRSDRRERNEWFNGGGTLWGLVNDFAEYILSGDYTNGVNGYAGLYCWNWGYPDEDMEAIQQYAKSIGYLNNKSL